MTHYLNTVDEHYENLVRERSQVIEMKDIKRLRSKYWAVLSHKNKEIDLNFNFIYKESASLIKEMDHKRFPNIKNLTLKRMERGEDLFVQFLSNSVSYKLDHLLIDECKISSIQQTTFNDLVRLIRQNVQEKLSLDSVVIKTKQALDILDAWESIKEISFGLIAGLDDTKFILKNKFRKLEVLKILAPDYDEWISFYSKLLSHLINNNALKRLREVHIGENIFHNRYYRNKELSRATWLPTLHNS